MTTTREPFFFALELDVYQPSTGGGTIQPYAYGHGSHPHGALTVLAQSASGDTTTTLRASDLGYRSRATDTIGLQVYPPVMEQAFEIDRHLALDPGQASTATFGAVRLSNLGQRYDAFVQGRNCDSRSARLLMGQKATDSARGILTDPAYSTLAPFFGGFAKSWQLNEEILEIPLADATYWADHPLQSNFYSGTGGLNGTSTIAGLPVPITRGGTAAAPVQNVPLLSVDPVSLIYQYTDGPGTVVTLYEGGAEVFVYDGDAGNLYDAFPPAPGHYRTCNALGLVQMGSAPVRALTADVTGQFPVAGVVRTAAAIARYVLTETMALSSSLIDIASFATVDTGYPYQAGFWVGAQATSGLQIVQGLLGSIGGRMISGRNGLIKAMVINTLGFASVAFSPKNAISVTPQALPSTLDPPPYRWRIGYAQNYSVQTSDFDGAATEARKAIIGQQWRLSTVSSSDVLTAWRRPNDPNVFQTYLTRESEAHIVADLQGQIWSGRPGVYAVEVPMDVAAQVDVGSIVSLTWPLGELSGGVIGQVVGEQIRSYDASCVLTVLMNARATAIVLPTAPSSTADTTQMTADSNLFTADL